MIELYEVVPPQFVPIEQAAGYVNRSAKTIYAWVKNEGVRTYKLSNHPVLVHMGDVTKIDALRAKGRRRKPRVSVLDTKRESRESSS